MKSFSFIALLCLLALVFAVAGSSAQQTCSSFDFNGNTVDPANWQVYFDTFNVSGTLSRVGFSLCTPVTNNNVQTGFVIVGEVGQSWNVNYNLFGTQTQFISPEGDQIVVLRYGSDSNTTYQADVFVRCNPNATSLRAQNYHVRSETDPNGVTHQFFDLESQVLCRSYNPPTTTFAPTAPFTTQFTTTSAGGQGDCRLIEMEGHSINPNAWDVVYGYVNVPQLPGTDTYLIIDVCLLNPGFTLTPDSTTRNYIVISPDNSTFNAAGFDSRILQEVNTFGHFVKYEFFSTNRPQDHIFVYIHCDPSATQLNWYGSSTGSVTYFNNTFGGNTYETHLGSADLCVTAPSTSRPRIECKPFYNSAGALIRPEMFPAGQSVFKNMMSGDSVTILFGTCHERTLPIANNSIAPGFVILWDANTQQQFPQISFDSIEEAGYLAVFEEYDIIYRTSAVNHTEDRFHLQILCGGTSSSLSFPDKYILPERNQQGGLTYRVQAKTKAMCGSATTTGFPTTTSGAPGTTNAGTTAAPFTTTLPPPPPPTTTGANILRMKNKK
jgi:hypothetical protein